MRLPYDFDERAQRCIWMRDRRPLVVRMLVAHFRAHWSCFTEQNAMLFSESDGKERNREVNKAGKRVGRVVTRRIARHSIKYAECKQRHSHAAEKPQDSGLGNTGPEDYRDRNEIEMWITDEHLAGD